MSAATSTMTNAGTEKPKRLVICCDGTWNKEDQKTKNGQPCPTNVLRLFELIAPCDGDGCLQICHYERGVGNRWDERISGGGFGFGISDNIKDAYKFLVSNYDDGDQIFLFGFSRGAFAVRSLAGMVYNVGILRREELHLLEDAFKYYRDRSRRWRPSSDDSQTFRKNHAHQNKTIVFLGVWDTVGALGAPFGIVTSWLTNLVFHTRFHDTKISPIILNAYHAMAIDERRWPFRPTHMELTNERKCEIGAASASNEKSQYNYEEVWFPGVHSDVGGGYENANLSDCALQWMVEKATAHGLSVNSFESVKTRSFAPNPLVHIHDSQSFLYRIATKIFVYWPKAALKLIWRDEATLFDRIQKNGDFIRQLDRSETLAAAIGQFPINIGYTIDLSDFARKKLTDDPDYAPVNLKRAR
jgi:uncharacterized protein (DUF2235 family)